MSAQRRRELIRRGFTLVELVVVIVVLGVLAAASMPILKGGFNTYFAGVDIMEADSQARMAMERITRDLRRARSTSDLLNISLSNQIQFIDTDGVTITYVLPAGTTTLNRITTSTQPLADNVSALSFSYLQFSGVGPPAATPATVSYITVSLTMSRGISNATYRSTVKPWNF